MTNKVNALSHPNHIDLGRMEPSPGYRAALGRFQDILEKKLGMANRPDLTMSLIEHSKQSGSHLRLRGYAHMAEDIIADVTKRTPAVAQRLDGYFKGTPLEGLGSEFEKAQKKTGINGIFLAALAALESGTGSSAIARDKNNLFGFQAYDGSPYESAAKFDSFASSIDYVSDYLKREYLSEQGSYYRGRAIEDINRNYATDKNWHKKISAIIGDILK